MHAPGPPSGAFPTILWIVGTFGPYSHAGEQIRRGLHVGDVAGRRHQRAGAADDVGERVDPGRPATARAADCLRLSPFYRRTPNAERCALTQVLSIAVLRVTAPASTSASSSFRQKHAPTSG